MFSRRTLLRLGSGGVAAAALGGAAWEVHRRSGQMRQSASITEQWPALGMMWLRADIRGARMFVPDRPHAVREVIDLEARARVRAVRSFRVSTSARRMRDDSYKAFPARGKRRILVVGDSVSFGWGVEGHESWPALLVGELEARGIKVEVLNAAVPALKVEGMGSFLMTQARELAPTGVIFARRPVPAQGRYDAYARILRESAGALPNVRFHVLMPPASTFDPDVFVDHADQRAQIAARSKVPITDVTERSIARRGSTGCVLEGTVASHVVRSLATGEVVIAGRGADGALAPEVYALLDRSPELREPFFFDQGHLSADGHALVASTVAEDLVRAGWFG